MAFYNIQFVDANGGNIDDHAVNTITEERVEEDALNIIKKWGEEEQAEIAGFYVVGACSETLGKCWFCRIERTVRYAVTRI